LLKSLHFNFTGFKSVLPSLKNQSNIEFSNIEDRIKYSKMNRQIKIISTIILIVIIASCTKAGLQNDIINLIPVKTGAGYRYIDPLGKLILKPQFKKATVFRNGMALVQLFGSKPMWGFINEDGRFAIKAIYKEATVFSEDIAWVVCDNQAPKAINRNGDSLFTIRIAKSVRIFKDGLAAFSITVDSVNVKWGYVDKKGSVKIPPQFTASDDFSDGKCAVSNAAGEWGYIDVEGRLIINYQFTSAKKFINGKAIVQSGKEWGVIDNKGKFVINPLFSEMKADKDMYIIKQNNKWGWCNKNGNTIIDPQYDDACPFNGNELAPVKSGVKYGFINKKGKLMIDAQFQSSLPFNGNIAWVMNAGKGGFIDKNAKFIIQPRYESVSEDLKSFILNGSSTYEAVNTDCFDVDTIVNRIKKDITENTVAGLTYSSPMSLIFKKYKKTDVDFVKNASEHKIITTERISNDATLDFFILGTPWTETYNGKLAYSYTLKRGFKFTGFTYRINITTKGLGKENLVIKSLETALKGYTKDEIHSNENVLILKSNFQLIVVLEQTGMIILAIYPLTAENLHMIDVNYGDGSEPDSTTVALDTIAIKK